MLSHHGQRTRVNWKCDSCSLLRRGPNNKAPPKCRQRANSSRDMRAGKAKQSAAWVRSRYDVDRIQVSISVFQTWTRVFFSGHFPQICLSHECSGRLSESGAITPCVSFTYCELFKLPICVFISLNVNYDWALFNKCWRSLVAAHPASTAEDGAHDFDTSHQCSRWNICAAVPEGWWHSFGNVDKVLGFSESGKPSSHSDRRCERRSQGIASLLSPWPPACPPPGTPRLRETAVKHFSTSAWFLSFEHNPAPQATNTRHRGGGQMEVVVKYWKSKRNSFPCFKPGLNRSCI